MTTAIPTANCSHGSCFICKERNRSLHRIKKQDIIHAYVNHSIYIKDHSRCCDAHYDENGLIRKEEFFIIPTREQAHSLKDVEMLEMLSAKHSNVFERFKDIKYLEDEHCKQITGWSKDEFIRFSEYIVSIHNTEQRNKEQLIALYRYWLRTGIDQKSLAAMFGNNTNQRTISLYLETIRAAIYKEFVPCFLGAKENRDFYLRYNTFMTHKLFDLKKDDLVIVADGTYSKIEKSSNNDFQFKTYSVQKSGSLFKPFIICCADGYIIDCYGPFSANSNDSTILNYILETDNDLMKILLPHKTLVLLDRGFRDSLENLRTKHLNPKIPTCSQLEDNNGKQLTIKQANESRRVTKCRFIIEKKIGEIKKHLALNNRRNTEVGRLQTDYRIVCAMLNFVHKPCCADGPKAEKIAKRLKAKLDQIHVNHLEKLLNIRFGTTITPYIQISEITDFPKLSERKMVSKLFFGSYYIKQSKSYMADLKKNGTCSIINNKTIEKLETNLKSTLYKEMKTSKIIGMDIKSKYRRSLKKENNKDSGASYRVLVQYVPNLNSSKSIKSYLCSCKGGRKQAGCCKHVAAFIYYFSYAKFREHKLKLPGEHLYSILIDMTKMEAPNKPRRVRNRISKKIQSSSESSDSESDSDYAEKEIDKEKSNNISYDEINRSNTVCYDECIIIDDDDDM